MSAVLFRGPMLFLSRGKHMLRVLVPDGAHNPGGVGAHPDKSKAKPHFGGVLRVNAAGGRMDQREFFDPLDPTRQRRVRILISDDATGADDPCIRHGSMRTMVPVQRLVTEDGEARQVSVIREVDLDFWARTVAIVHFHGGTMDGRVRTFLSFNFPATFNTKPPKDRNISMLPTWSPRAGRQTFVTVRDDLDAAFGFTWTLAADEAVYLYNWDDPVPKSDRLRADDECKTEGTALEDHDFKWLYRLLVHKTGKWESVLPSGKMLPAPLSTCKHRPLAAKAALAAVGPLPHPDTSSCFNGEWCCGDDDDPEECDCRE